MSVKQKKCPKGHYYNANLYKQCPICQESQPNTVLMGIGGDLGSAPTPKNSNPKDNKKETKKTVYMGSDNMKDKNSNENNQEIKRDNSNNNVVKEEKIAKPVTLAGWIVIVSDNDKGNYYPITFGFNSIGRGSNNHIVIDSDNSISREKHASIIYDYSNNVYYIKHEDGKYLTYLNGEVVLETKKLKEFDKIKIGNTELLFVPLCGENFKWDDKNE